MFEIESPVTGQVLMRGRLDAVEAPDASASLAQRVSPGACGNLLLDAIRERLEQQISRAEGDSAR